MKKIIFTLFLLISFSLNTYTQIEDIFKKIPVLSDVFEEAVTTSIKDAYPPAYWLNGVEQKVNLSGGVNFSENLGSGYYKYRFNTFCLHAGTYAPTEGDGYLVAPLKGSKAGLIKKILSRSGSHPEIDQKDVQMLIWGIEAGEKFSDYPVDFQLRIKPLLEPEEIALMEVDIKEIGYDLLPDDVKEVLSLYRDIRGKISDVNSKYEDIERLAVKTGIAPVGKGSRNIPSGTWTSVGDNVYVRSIPESYKKSDVEIYIPADVKITRDNNGNVISMNDGTTKIDFDYAPGKAEFKTAIIKNLATNEEITVENSLTDISSFGKDADDFIKLVKKSFGKKKSNRLKGGFSKTISQLKSIEYSLDKLLPEKSGLNQNGYEVSVNAVNSYISSFETGNKKGGSKSRNSGLGNINGLVFAPANTSKQRLGNGGPEGGNGNEGNEDPNKNKDKEKPCNVSVTIHQVPENDLPVPDFVYTVNVDIFISGEDEKCQAEEIDFTLFDVSKERGRYMNDMEKFDDVDEDLQFSDLNQDYQITKTTAKKQISGKDQQQQVYIWCRDYGAFGKLKVSVKAGGKWYEGDGDGTPDKYITIPLDLNDNKIADSWEKQNKVYGKPGDWDEDPNPKGQARNGDGMTNYEEYRGFFVSDGDVGTQYVRCDPLQKEIFVYDKDKIFDIASWKAATGIKAYWLNLDMIYGTKGGGEKDQNYRWVNFCYGNAKGLKYAVQLVKVSGMSDPYNQHQGKYVFGYNDPGYGPPKFASRTVMFPDRIRNWMVEIADTLANTLKKFPNGFLIDGTNYSKAEVQHLINEIKNPAKLDVLVDFWLNLCVLHEVGHACNCHHHGGGDPKKTDSGDPKCPMKYRSEYTLVKLDKVMSQVMKVIEKEGITPIVSYIGWKFCKTKDNCWKQIDVNDR